MCHLLPFLAAFFVTRDIGGKGQIETLEATTFFKRRVTRFLAGRVATRFGEHHIISGGTHNGFRCMDNFSVELTGRATAHGWTLLAFDFIKFGAACELRRWRTSCRDGWWPHFKGALFDVQGSRSLSNRYFGIAK